MKTCSGTKCLKNQPCDVLKIREMRGEVGKKTPKKIWIIPHFYDVTWMIFKKLCPVTYIRSDFRLFYFYIEPWDVFVLFF